MQICPGCGVIAPSGRTACKVCETAFTGAPLTANGRVESALFACVHQCDFLCRSCGLRSPLGTVSLAGEVECQRCGLQQAFDVTQWKEGLGHAHTTADLSGPNPEGQFPGPTSIAAKNPHKGIGIEFTSSTNEQSSTIIDGRGMRQLSLRVSVSPGHPLCGNCKAPVEVAFDGRGATQTRCPRCQDVAVYGLPEKATTFYPALLAVLSADQRTDRPAVRVAPSQGGVEAILCPQCGAGLAIGPSEMVSCPYCHTTARVPKRLANKARGGEVPFDRFWLVLQGPSPGRAKLASGKSGDDDDDEEDEDDAPIPQNAAQMQQYFSQSQRQTTAMTKYIVIGSVVFTLLIGAIVTFGVVWQMLAPEPTPTHHATPVHR